MKSDFELGFQQGQEHANEMWRKRIDSMLKELQELYFSFKRLEDKPIRLGLMDAIDIVKKYGRK